MDFCYEFPAVRGVQAGREYYISMIPMKLLSRLFPTEEEIVLPEFRAQRRINESRIPEIKRYILENRETYVFSALSASIDGNFEFLSMENKNVGILRVDMSSTFLINDGQHRMAAINSAIGEDVTLGEETISIVFFKDDGLARSQQMFTDLNKHAVKTSNSLATLYDSRDVFAVATREVIESVPFFKMYTDKERDVLGKNSSKFFTLKHIYTANKIIVHGENCDDKDLEFLQKYWNLVAKNIVEWNEVMEKTLTKRALRENYILTLVITLNAFARLGKYFYDHQEEDMESYLCKLQKIDWLRSSDNWSERAICDGHVRINDTSIILTCSQIKRLIGIALSAEEECREHQIVK